MSHKSFVHAVCVIFLLVNLLRVSAQNDSAKPIRIAVLAPLYIDSVFDDTAFKGPAQLPKYMQPGLEFYNGAMLAVDSLQKENVPVEVWVYDTRKKQQTADALQKEMAGQNFSLIIASLANVTEQQSFARFAFSQNVPFVSATYPNDAGVTGNPFFIIINPTLKTHVEAVYTYVQHNFIGSKVYFVTRKGSMETRIKGYFDATPAKTATLKYNLLTLPDDFTADNLRPLVDSSAESVFVCGSLNDNFGINLVHALNNIAFAGQVTAAGMPTWDGVKAFAGDACRNVNIVYSTPYNFNRTGTLPTIIAEEYQQKFNTRPGDMVLKGFEAMYHFTHLLVKHGNNLLSNISDPSFKIYNDFNFLPVHLTAASFAPDYLENKKLYFVTMLNGEIKTGN